jgi:hypothetical protein
MYGHSAEGLCPATCAIRFAAFSPRWDLAEFNETHPSKTAKGGPAPWHKINFVYFHFMTVNV